MAELIPLDRIEANPFQPRLSEDPDHVRKIAESIGQHGLLQNPVGRYVDETGKPVLANAARVQLAFGHTRLAAFRLYAVLGKVSTAPEIVLRVGVYGHFYDLYAPDYFDLPDGMLDAAERAYAEETAAWVDMPLESEL